MIGRHKYELSLPDVPPSLNRVGSRGSHWAFTAAKRNWEMMLLGYLNQARPVDGTRGGTGIPRGLIQVWASAHLTFPTKRRRDEGNFRMMIEKSLGDILVKQGYLEDDDADRYSFQRLTFEEKLGPKLTVITLEVEREAAG